jgi:hypothetical protein
MMCGHHGHRSFRGFGRRGFPSRDVWVERLEAYREHLEQELKNVQDVIERLGRQGDTPEQTGTA